MSASAAREPALKIRTALFAATLFAATSAQAAILEDFESYTSATPFETFSSALGTAWTVNGTVDVVSVGGLWEGNGNYTLDLNGDDQGSITTVLTGLVAGQEYQVSFLFGGNMQGSPNGVRGFTVTADGASNTFDNPSQSLQTGFLSFVAGGTSASLSFASNVPGNAGAVLDDISIAAVPEPHEWAMMLAGLGLVGWAARRRREAPASSAATAA